MEVEVTVGRGEGNNVLCNIHLRVVGRGPPPPPSMPEKNTEGEDDKIVDAEVAGKIRS